MGNAKAYIAAVVIQCSMGGMMVLVKAALSSGMKISVFVAYRQAFAAVVLLPFAIFFPSKDCSPLTWTGYCKFFFAYVYGLALSVNLNFAGLKRVSPTVCSAIISISLPLIFVTSVCLRVDKVAITQPSGVAKTAGTIVSVCGTMAFTFYKGPPMYSDSRIDHAHHSFDEMTTTNKEWIEGSLLFIAGTLMYSLWLIHQARLLKQYPGTLRFAALQSVFSCLASSVYAAATERHLLSWKLGLNIQLLSLIYAGVIVTGMGYLLQAWVIEKKGPIFYAIFGPLALIMAAILSAIFLEEALHWGSFVGCGLVVVGLYIFLWGSNQEIQIKAQQQSAHSAEEIYVDDATASISPDSMHPSIAISPSKHG